MEATSTNLAGVRLIELEPFEDLRGRFARVFDETAFAELGLETTFPHHNLVTNPMPGTLRGLHYQLPPLAETKVVLCVSGAVFDVLVDIRPDSTTFGAWESVVLDSDRPQLLYVPEGVAHGYQTLSPDTTVHYLIGEVYAPDLQRGIAWDEPLLGITWPQDEPILSTKDTRWPPLDWSRVWPSGQKL